jgi:hypothetical protein
VALPIASPGRLDDAVQRTHGAQDSPEIQVDAGLDDLGGHHPAELASLEASLDLADDTPAVGTAEEGGEM